MGVESTKNSAERRLTSWKEIAAFVGRDERTVKRWEESRGLPVRRVPGAGRASVFAYPEEIEAWLRGSASPALSGAQSHLTEIVLPFELQEKRAGSRSKAAIGLFAVAIVTAAAIYVGQWESARIASSQVHSGDPVADGLYRSGLHEWQTRTPSGLAMAVADFTRAIKRDPNFAPAYAGLADTYNLDGEFTALPPGQAYPAAAAAARHAIALDPSLASAHAALAFADFYWARDVAGAEREFKRSIELDPRSAVAHHWYATFLMTLGDMGGAEAEIDKAQNLDSESTAIPADKALILFHAGRTGQAVRLLTQLENDNPDFASPHRYLATIWLFEGADAAYLHELKLAAHSRHDSRALALAEAGAQGLAHSGHQGMLRDMRDAQMSLYATGEESAYAVATTCAELGDRRAALNYLDVSITRHEAENIALKIDPSFESMRKDGRFVRLLSEAGVVRPLGR